MSDRSEELQKLLDQVGAWVQQSPEDSTLFLDIVSKALVNYRKAVAEERRGLSIKAIDDLVTLLGKPDDGRVTKMINYQHMPQDRRYVFLIDAVLHNFPNGWDSVYCERDKEFLFNFCLQYFDGKKDREKKWEGFTLGRKELMDTLEDQWTTIKKEFPSFTTYKDIRWYRT
jgi:hypothetical protein